jgi:protein TonB
MAGLNVQRCGPIPAPPTRFLNGNGQLELFEGWMFNDNGQFQLQTLHSPQATSIT